MLAKLAQGSRRRHHDQRVEIVAQRPLAQQIGRLRGKAILLDLVEIGFLHGTASVADTLEGAARAVGLDVAVGRLFALPFAFHFQLQIVAVSIIAEKEHFRSEEHTSELQSLMRISYDVFCLKK